MNLKIPDITKLRVHDWVICHWSGGKSEVCQVIGLREPFIVLSRDDGVNGWLVRKWPGNIRQYKIPSKYHNRFAWAIAGGEFVVEKIPTFVYNGDIK